MRDKKCIKCEEYKSFTDFHKDKKSHDGLHPWCRECKKAHDRQPLQKLRRIYNRQAHSSKIRRHESPMYTRE